MHQALKHIPETNTQTKNGTHGKKDLSSLKENQFMVLFFIQQMHVHNAHSECKIVALFAVRILRLFLEDRTKESNQIKTMPDVAQCCVKCTEAICLQC